mgnify:CR=1 FL=1
MANQNVLDLRDVAAKSRELEGQVVTVEGWVRNHRKQKSIGFIEFFATHQNIVGVNYLYFPSATIEMIGYLILTLVASILLRLLERIMDGSDSYDLVQTDALTMSAGTYNHPSKGTPFDERSKEYRGDAWEEKGER